MPHEINKREIAKSVAKRTLDIGIRVRLLRKQKDFTQQDLAFYSFSDKSLISDIERGLSNNITLFTLFKIASVLGVSEDYLFTGK